MTSSILPVVIIGGGPVGLAAAAHAVSMKLTPLVLEAGDAVGAGVMKWAHVRMFSPWKFNVDPAAVAILSRYGWNVPDGDAYPTGRELVEKYLRPLAATPELSAHVQLNRRVVAVSRLRHDRMKDGGRDGDAFVVRVETGGREEDILARAVVDASGTIENPAPLGASGLPAIGERSFRDRISYGLPDVLGSERHRFANRRVLVAGSGHSAFNVLLDLATLAESEGNTRIYWIVRRPALGQKLGGGRKDQLIERGNLGAKISALLDAGRITLLTNFNVERVVRDGDGVAAQRGSESTPVVDEIVVATGFRPDWSILSELRLDLDPAVESPKALGPLIDPNVHSCGSVPPHGAEELKHPEPNVFAIGMKSYGRAPTFLMLTGYEQARSVISAIAGDWQSARRVELVLPETGVCSVERDAGATASCCSAAPEPVAVPITIGGLSSRVARSNQSTAHCCGS
jgi:thioredoxin reductase